ncbi:O-antigen ligase family protein [Nitrosomonas supralitoralis]|uniref:Ligase n=1 Tax=Nitrosomonas supralitoralis TaxID=2116706 RepID=A0A2P7NUC8_9PROT|nr:O-antigen ligase family protein [Nitrosomonas supralitoralis]PSJ17074.1 ligase [Nitrosomonas supralitoralis]
MQTSITRQEWFIRFALIFFGAGFWRGELMFVSFPLLIVAWFMDGGVYRLNQEIKVPLTQAILLLCTLLLLGLLWSESPQDGRMKWLKYFTLLIFIPFYSLMNKERLPWALYGLIASYLCVLAVGVYQWLAIDVQGVPLLGMSYLSFSAMLGVGAIITSGIACMSPSTKVQIFFVLATLTLLFIQFHQNGRTFLLATLISILLTAFLRFKIEMKKFFSILACVLIVSVAFAYNSPAFQARLNQIKIDIELMQQGNYSSSLGYRLAMWDVGLHGIAARPLLGFGTGMPEKYFDKTISTYKNGLYKDLPKFQETVHYHNDWIEIGMHIGISGVLALGFLLWSWYQAFNKSHLNLLGSGLISFIILAGLADTFVIFSRTPILLLIITTIAIGWRKREQEI